MEWDHLEHPLHRLALSARWEWRKDIKGVNEGLKRRNPLADTINLLWVFAMAWPTWYSIGDVR